jgi:hypothetical protein
MSVGGLVRRLASVFQGREHRFVRRRAAPLGRSGRRRRTRPRSRQTQRVQPGKGRSSMPFGRRPAYAQRGRLPGWHDHVQHERPARGRGARHYARAPRRALRRQLARELALPQSARARERNGQGREAGACRGGYSRRPFLATIDRANSHSCGVLKAISISPCSGSSPRPSRRRSLKETKAGDSRALSQAVMGNIRQNLFFAFICNALGVPVAAGVLYPFLGILLSPIIAAILRRWCPYRLTGVDRQLDQRSLWGPRQELEIPS